MKINTDPKKIQEVLTHGVEEIHVRESLERKLMSGKSLRIKLGIDPTGAKIHVGRASVLWKFREFQDLGHKIVLIVGDYTAQIGDASDKLSKRPFLSVAQITKNMAHYKQQIGKILDLKKVEWHYNSLWLGKLKSRELDGLADLFSVQQMIARRNFKERWEKQEEISLRELHYPLYQGYDSVKVKADVEIGGTDQLFNLLAGRKIQEAFGQKPQDIMTCKMLMGLDGRKMSTSWGNVITIVDEPADMYGKIMSMRDDLLSEYALLVARMSDDESEAMARRIKNGANPRDLKMEIARKTVALYHGEKAASRAQEEFGRVFQKKEMPKEMGEYKLSFHNARAKQNEKIKIQEILIETKLASSKSEARRLVEQGGIKVDGNVVNDVEADVSIPEQGVVLQKGKRGFIKVKQK